jgi:hypothetical protein
MASNSAITRVLANRAFDDAILQAAREYAAGLDRP